MNGLYISLGIWGALSVLIAAAYAGINMYMKSKREEQRFVTRQEIYEMGYDCGFLNKGFDASAFDFIENEEMCKDMLLVMRGGFVEGLQDYHYLLKDNPLN